MLSGVIKESNKVSWMVGNPEVVQKRSWGPLSRLLARSLLWFNFWFARHAIGVVWAG
jgi:hypothetical protein